MSLVVRDHMGRFLAASMDCDQGPLDALLAEAIVIEMPLNGC